MAKKRHHFIPKAYLKAFCDNEGQVYACRKDDPATIIRVSPNGVGLHRYFYSQPIPGGGVDHDKLENLFSEYETKWPLIVDRLQQKECVNDCLEDISAFIALQRVRVPAARDASEALLANHVKALMQQMEANGELPPPPKELKHIFNNSEVAIDPHQSIHAMIPMIRGIGELLDRIGICAIHNKTATPFLTSDNPVIWFDPSVPSTAMRPYAVQQDGQIMLFFPVAPNLAIYGDTTVHDYFVREGLWHKDITEDWWIDRMNEQICRFAYKTVFAQRAGFEGLVKQHADVSPVIETQIIPAPNGQYLFHQHVFGQRTRKPKWRQSDR